MSPLCLTRVHPRLGVAALLVVVALAGCGRSASSDVRTKVMQFAAAVHRYDYRALCESVLAPALLADIAAGGLSCEHALSLGLARVRSARLVIGKISVRGAHASVLTLSQAQGEPTALATLELTDTAAGWRIVSLGNAAR